MITITTVDKSYKSFKYITDHYNISQAGLYKRITKFNELQLNKNTGITFQNKFMKLDHHKWFISPAGVKLITFTKKNSTSPFKPKKATHYKEKHLTRNDLLNRCHELTKSNNRLIKAVGELSHNNAKLSDAIKEQGKQLKLSGDHQDHLTNLTNKLTYQKTVKHSFWWHLWHKY